MPREGYRWTDELTARACALAAKGWIPREIGEEIGVSDRAVIQRFVRLREAGDPRAPVRTPTTREAVAGLAPIDAVAEVFARGAAPSAVASRLGMAPTLVHQLWAEIVRRRGPQAV